MNLYQGMGEYSTVVIVNELETNIQRAQSF
jgi:hypothetical protein